MLARNANALTVFGCSSGTGNVSCIGCGGVDGDGTGDGGSPRSRTGSAGFAGNI